MKLRPLLQFAGPSVLAAGAWFVFGWFPSQPSAAADRQSEAQSELAVLSAELGEARSLEAELTTFAAEIAVAESAVPADRSIDDFGRSADEAATSAGIAIDQIAPLAVSSDTDPESSAQLPSGTSSVSISIGATGTYPGLMGFVAALEALDRLVLVDSIEMRADEADSSIVVLDLEVRIFTTENLVSVSDFDDEFGALEDEPLDEEI